MVNSIVIGAGIAGAVIARELAENGGEKVLLIEQRNHIGGNCYDLVDEHGIRIHQYGPHIFHTNSERVFAYLSKFTNWYKFGHEVVANVYGELIPVPFNLNTLHKVYEPEKAKYLEEKLIELYGLESRVPILELMKHPNQDIRSIGEYVYKNIFLQYTLKQWGQKPEEIDPSVTGRVPILISYDNRYFQDQYQGMPLDGYTCMFEKLLAHPNIELQLGKNANEKLKIKGHTIYFENNPFLGKVIYTGPIDELFDSRYGKLPYRSLKFIFENYQTQEYQGYGVVNYTVSEAYTRITEFKHLTGQKNEKSTTILKEYPMNYTGGSGEIPCYAIINQHNLMQYNKYLDLTQNIPNLYLLGRLAEYKYYNIDTMVEKALILADQLLDNRERLK